MEKQQTAPRPPRIKQLVQSLTRYEVGNMLFWTAFLIGSFVYDVQYVTGIDHPSMQDGLHKIWLSFIAFAVGFFVLYWFDRLFFKRPAKFGGVDVFLAGVAVFMLALELLVYSIVLHLPWQ